MPVTISAFTWNSGRPASTPSPGVRPDHSAIPRAQASWFACVCAAIFGAPVVPPVCTNAARSAAPGGRTPARNSAGWPPASSSRYRAGMPGSPSRAGGTPVAPSGRSAMTARIRAWRATAVSRCQSPGSASGPAAISTGEPVRPISAAIRSAPSAGLTGAAIPAACAARVAASSPEQFGPHSVTASSRRIPSRARPLAIRVTVPASSA